MKFILKIEPKPQARARARRGGVYEDPRMKVWRRRCRMLVERAWRGRVQLIGALEADVKFYIKPPKYVSQVKKNQVRLLSETIPVGKKPDIDNYEKALYDSMSGIVFKDDGQIARHCVCKLYSVKPRIEVEIKEIGD